MDMSLSKLHELVMDREPGMLQSVGSQRVKHNWVTELTVLSISNYKCLSMLGLMLHTEIFFHAFIG